MQTNRSTFKHLSPETIERAERAQEKLRLLRIRRMLSQPSHIDNISRLIDAVRELEAAYVKEAHTA